MPNPVPKGPQAKTQKKADAIAGLVLKEVFKPELGRGQFTDAHKQTLIGSINVSLGQNGFEQNYSIKRLDAWLSNTLYRYRMAQNKRKPPSWQPKKEKGALALLDLLSPTDGGGGGEVSPSEVVKRPRYPSASPDASTEAAVAAAAADVQAQASAAAVTAEFAEEAAVKARQAQAAAAVVSSMYRPTGPESPDRVGTSPFEGMPDDSLSPPPGLVTILGRHLGSPVLDELPYKGARPPPAAPPEAMSAAAAAALDALMQEEAPASARPAAAPDAAALLLEAAEQEPDAAVSGMIGCDGGCDGWFHLSEVGMTQAEADANSTWSCETCATNNAPAAAAAPSLPALHRRDTIPQLPEPAYNRPTLVRSDTLPLSDADLQEQAAYEGLMLDPLDAHEATLMSPPQGAQGDDRARVLNRTATQEEREQDPNANVNAAMERSGESGHILAAHLKRQHTDPYVLSRLSHDKIEAQTDERMQPAGSTSVPV